MKNLNTILLIIFTFSLTSLQSISQQGGNASASNLSAESDSFASAANDTSRRIFTVRTNIHHISNLNFRDQEYKIEFWLYILSNRLIDDSFKDQIAVKDAKESDFTFISQWRELDRIRKDYFFADSKSETLTYDTCYRRILRVRSTMIQKWNIVGYPFDDQKLDITIYRIRPKERGLLRPVENKINYADVKDTVWEIENGWYSIENSVIADSVVDIFANDQKYPALHYQILLKRYNTWGLFFKMSIGIYVAFMVAFIGMFIPIYELEPRFGLPVGGLFAAIANKYIIESLLPPSPQYILIDKLHAAAIISILLIIIYSAILQFLIRKYKTSGLVSVNTRKKPNDRFRNRLSYMGIELKRLDTIVIGMLFSIYLIINIVFISLAKIEI